MELKNHNPINVREQIKKTRSWLDKTADLISAWCGSWSFLLLHIVWFGWWLVAQYNIHTLTMIVSLEAIILMAILLMTQNRAAVRDNLRDEADYQADLSAEHMISEVKYLLEKIEKDLQELKRK